MLPQYEWPINLSQKIQLTLKEHFGLEVSRDRKIIAQYIYKMSCFYQEQPTAATPWEEHWVQVAQLIYFLPLNYLRFMAAMNQLPKEWRQRFGGVFDFGAGLSPVYWYLIHTAGKGKLPFLAVDGRTEAKDLSVALGFPCFNYVVSTKVQETISWAKRSLAQGVDTLVLSFSLTENNLPILKQLLPLFSRVFLLEPGMRKDTRSLMLLREECLQNGWRVLAPCLHQKACPLLKWSQRDWCHFQFKPVLPNWFLEVIAELPLHPDEHLSYSFLLLEKEKPNLIPPQNLGKEVERPFLSKALRPRVNEKIMGEDGIDTALTRRQEEGLAPTLRAEEGTKESFRLHMRVIGAARTEKGKTIQAVCVDEQRSFLVWPHRLFGKRPPTPLWGEELILSPSKYQEKGQAHHRELVIREL